MAAREICRSSNATQAARRLIAAERPVGAALTP